MYCTYRNIRWPYRTFFLTHWGRGEIDTILQTTSSNIFSLNENIWISIKISMKFIPRGSINNFPALVQIMAWCRPGDKPLSEPMIVRSLTHMCVTRLQWVKDITNSEAISSRFSFLTKNYHNSLWWNIAMIVHLCIHMNWYLCFATYCFCNKNCRTLEVETVIFIFIALIYTVLTRV